MELGAILPQFEPGDAPDRYRQFARTAEDLGYDHLLAYDHVVGPHPDREGWEGVYTYEIPLHEPLTLFGYLAAVTERVRLVTGILILPQRQTALVAKQAAEADVLSDGRLRLGIGVGWNAPEYVALGEEFSARGRRVEEQIEVLRRLWTEDLVEYEGEFHEIPEVGINPHPVQQQVPVWMGGGADVVLRRIARTGDGWLLPGDPPAELEGKRDRLADYLEEEGRDLDDLALLARTDAGLDPEEVVERAREWREFGATHVAVDVSGDDPAGRLEAIAEAVEASDVSASLEP